MSTILRNASPQQLQKAIAQNHCDLFLMDTRIKDGITHVEEGFFWTYISSTGSGCIMFPELSGTAKLNEAMDFYQKHPTRNLECWSLDTPETENLDVLLLARGFQTGWLPCWMVLDLHSVVRPSYTSRDELQIVPDNESYLNTMSSLPYAGRDYQYTLMHAAAERNDIELAQLALSFGPDLQILDVIHNGSPLGWAYHMQRKEIEEMIKAYIRRSEDAV